jgi:DNA ligase-1
MLTLNKIYKQRSDGGNQVWWGELDREGGRYRTHAGKVGGVITTSEWTYCEPKNTGRANATTAGEQAEAELSAMYRKRLEREYHENVADLGQVRYIKPMLASKWKDRKSKIPRNALVFFQPKLDGMRAIARLSTITASGVSLTSRDGKLIPGAKHIEEQLAPLFRRIPDLILDGELYNHLFKDKFEELISALKREPKNDSERELARSVVQYHVYDIPSEADKNFGVRWAALDELFANEEELLSDMIRLVSTQSLVLESEETPGLMAMLAQALEDGYEGGMLRLNLPYEFKRSNSLMKMKDFQDAEFEIAGAEEGKGNWAGYCKRIWIVSPDAPVSHGDNIINRDTGEIEKFDGTQKNYHRVSKATPKGSQEYCKQLLEQDIVGKWGTVQFFRITNDGVPYLPIFKGVRWDDPRNK